MGEDIWGVDSYYQIWYAVQSYSHMIPHQKTWRDNFDCEDFTVLVDGGLESSILF